MLEDTVVSATQGAPMLTSGSAVKLSIYLSDGAKHLGIPVYTSLLDFLFKNGVYGASVFKGVAGFGSTHRLHSAHILEISDHLPIKIEIFETRDSKAYRLRHHRNPGHNRPRSREEVNLTGVRISS
jgi:hypothetical protein